MAQVEIYHPVTEGRAFVDEVSLPHYYRAGWMLAADWDARQEAEAQQQAKPASSSRSSASTAKEK